MRATELHRAPLAARLAISGFVLVAIAGLSVCELLVNYSLHGLEHVELPGLESIRARYAYPRLKAAVLTDMGEYLDDPSEGELIARWCDEGGGRYGFYERVEPVLARRCAICHGNGATRGDVSLVTWAEVAPLSTVPGASVEELSSTTHTHLFAIGLLLLVLGGLFALTRFADWLKLALVALAYLSLAAEVGGWWLARLSEGWALLVLVAGLLLALSIATLGTLLLVDLWRLERRA